MFKFIPYLYQLNESDTHLEKKKILKNTQTHTYLLQFFYYDVALTIRVDYMTVQLVSERHNFALELGHSNAMLHLTSVSAACSKKGA